MGDSTKSKKSLMSALGSMMSSRSKAPDQSADESQSMKSKLGSKLASATGVGSQSEASVTDAQSQSMKSKLASATGVGSQSEASVTDAQSQSMKSKLASATGFGSHQSVASDAQSQSMRSKAKSALGVSKSRRGSEADSTHGGSSPKNSGARGSYTGSASVRSASGDAKRKNLAERVSSGFSQQEADTIAEKRVSEIKISEMTAKLAVLSADLQQVNSALAENKRLSTDLDRYKEGAKGDLSKRVNVLAEETKKEGDRLSGVRADILARRKALVKSREKETDLVNTPVPRFSYLDIEESLSKHAAYLA